MTTPIFCGKLVAGTVLHPTGGAGAAVGPTGSLDAELPDRFPLFGLLMQDGEHLGGDFGKRP